MSVIKKSLKRQWSFSNLVGFSRIHILNNIHLTKFLESPENQWKMKSENVEQLGLYHDYFASGYNSINETENYIFSSIAFCRV